MPSSRPASKGKTRAEYTADNVFWILMVLYERILRGMGMAEICRAVGISQSQFSQMIAMRV